MSLRSRLPLIVLLLALALPLAGQELPPEDSLFHLLQAERAEQYEQYGMHYRLVQGNARFFHNDTYLLCDSASWNVDAKFIEAFGNVQVIQNNTLLKSDEMVYWIDESKAQFRGPVVELLDKDGNVLRTSNLTYNTKDSVAVFSYGGAMKDKDGGVIESERGTYDGKEGMFTFENRVELYLDSIEIKTTNLRYMSDEEKAYFGRETFLWRGNGFLRADAGWHDRKALVDHFSDHVFMFDPSYDAWADELYYDQQTGSVDLYRNAQVLDTTNKTAYLGDHLQYLPATDSLSQRGLLTGEPAIVYFGENENHVVDTLFARADTIFVYTVPRCDVPEAEVNEAKKRLDDIHFDALAKKRSEEGAKREEERIKKMREVGMLPPEWVERQRDSLAAVARADSLAAIQHVADSLAAIQRAADSLAAVAAAAVADSLAALAALDSTSVIPVLDSLVIPAFDSTSVIPGLTRDPDSLAVDPPIDSSALSSPRDTTPIRYVHAWHGVRMYRSDMQGKCDSLVFCELDSIARLYTDPVLWNEGRNQLTADEMHLLMENSAISRGSMITNAWLISQQDSIHFNQIKSAEMLGYFRDNELYRFDALGGVSAIFYMAEEDVITTINVKESRSLTAALKDGTAKRLLYTESIKSDAYPVGQLAPEKQRLKDFNWRGDERPLSRDSITTRVVRTSERDAYADILPPMYRETNKYFDNYMRELFERRAAERAAEEARRQAERDSLAAMEAAEALAAMPAADTTALIPAIDTSAVMPALDTTAVMPALDTLVKPEPDSAVMPGLNRHLEPAADTIRPRIESGVTGGIEPAVKDAGKPEMTPASPETVEQSLQLSRAEQRALRRAKRIAMREARRAERLARKEARRAEREARRAEREARKKSKQTND